MVDYMVVGLGLAGISFCEVLEQHGKSFIVCNDTSQQASKVAGGLYNPVLLKRFTLAWKGREQVEQAKPFYARLAQKLRVQLDYPLPVLRRFASVQEQNSWWEAAARPGLDHFLSPTHIPNTNPALHAPFGFGQVQHTGRIDTQTLVAAYAKHLTQNGRLISETFDFTSLRCQPTHLCYKGIQAKHLVFACGYGLKNNPFFNYLPLNGTKGELLTLTAPTLKENRIIKASIFTFPLEADRYGVGATYRWKDKTNTPTPSAKEELLKKLGTFFTGNFEVTHHLAGIRPTVVDRRPLVGQHPQYKNLYVLNGLGSRGVLIAPYAARQLFKRIERGTALASEMDIGRFTAK